MRARLLGFAGFCPALGSARTRVGTGSAGEAGEAGEDGLETRNLIHNNMEQGSSGPEKLPERQPDAWKMQMPPSAAATPDLQHAT